MTESSKVTSKYSVSDIYYCIQVFLNVLKTLATQLKITAVFFGFIFPIFVATVWTADIFVGF